MKLHIIPENNRSSVKDFAVIGYYTYKGYRVDWKGHDIVYCFDDIAEAIEAVADVVEALELEKDDFIFVLELGGDKYLYIDVCDAAHFIADEYNEQTYITDLCDIKWIQFP
ncbi:MAG: hypothetical protein JHC26_02825 [Thermofilum sp.]|uniref:hypothetical protein n=1 Tax=Thermofilum sp. TaxID=1961369 RepID=UPI00258E2D31|nr:hypothetical protein [Thermofilum sp.]MCI4408000.1 hypothetical protein [Thermofilum sp.]